MGARMSAEAVIWHDLECGAYEADLPQWHELAQSHPGTVLDVGAGTGRVALALARAGHRVVALERDGVLAAELSSRAGALAVEVLCADACDFSLKEPVALAIVPMQTIHLLADRDAFLRCARRALTAGGLLAVALLGEGVEPFELELEPDTVELGAVRYESAPTALRREGGAVLLERRRSRIAAGASRQELDHIRLHELDSATLAREARAAGFSLKGSLSVPATVAHAGSEIVCLEVAP
jgi:SAM-dependent methyltransferase